MASLFRANVPYTRPFHGARGAKTGLCERHTATASQRRGNAGDLEHVSAPAPKPRTISGCRARPRPPGAARPWHLGRPQSHGFQRTESGGPRLELRLLAATVQSWDSGLTPRVAAATPWGALFCASGFAGLLNRRRNATGFICISSLPALKALARSHLHRTQPIGGRLRAKNANSNDMSGRGPPVGYANTLSLSPAGDTQSPAHHTWLFGPDVLSGGRGGLILPPGDTQP